MMIILLSAIRRGSPEAVAILEMWRGTQRGLSLNQFGGGSCFLKHHYLNRSWISSSPLLVRRGSRAPIVVSAWPINCTEYSNMWDCT